MKQMTLKIMHWPICFASNFDQEEVSKASINLHNLAATIPPFCMGFDSSEEFMNHKG